MEPILEIYGRNPNILGRAFIGLNVDGEMSAPPVTCTLKDELKTPAHRPSVQAMIKDGRQTNKFKKFWSSRTGLGYYPFHR